MSEQVPTEQSATEPSVTESYLAEIEAAELAASGLLDGPDGEGLDARARATIKHLREATKRHRKVIDQIRSEAISVARAELIAERQRESAFRRLNVPPTARTLFDGVNYTDHEAMQQRAAELRQAGVSWPGMPQPAPPPPDHSQTVALMQMAAAGAQTPVSAGDLKARMLDMRDHPDRYSDQQIAGIVDEYNRAVTAAGRTGTSGALG